MANDCIPFYRPGQEITAIAEAAVGGKKFVAISGDRTSPVGLNTGVTGGNYQVSHAVAGERAFGVAAFDAAIGKHVNVYAGTGFVVPVVAGADIDAGELVEVGAAGVAIPVDTGIAVGMCLTAAANGADAEILLFFAGPTGPAGP